MLRAAPLLLALLVACAIGKHADEGGEKWKHIFGAMDSDSSGYLEKKEQNVLAKQMAQASSEKQTVKQMKAAVRTMDTDSDGKLSPAEFAAAWAASSEPPSKEDQWKEIFTANDENKSGALEQDEMKRLAILMATATKKQPEQMIALLQAMDTNKDGSLDPGEFLKGWKGEVSKEGMLDVLFPGDEIEYKAADGTMKRMTKEQMMAQMQEQEEHISAMGMGGAGAGGDGGAQGGQVPRTSKGSLKREEVEEKNPQVHFRQRLSPSYISALFSAPSLATPADHHGRVCTQRAEAWRCSPAGSDHGWPNE
jgi:Ca2+-binding EF-hand superfamily protein